MIKSVGVENFTAPTEAESHAEAEEHLKKSSVKYLSRNYASDYTLPSAKERLAKVQSLQHTHSFDKKVLVLGSGSVSKCVLPIFFHLVKVPYSHVTVMDFQDKTEILQPFIEKGLRFVKNRITQENYERVFNEYLSEGDVFLDLSWDVDTIDMIDYCHRHKILYVNTSLEVWCPYAEEQQSDPKLQTLYTRHMSLREHVAKNWRGTERTSSVLDHGANPGLVSHFLKQGMLDIVKYVNEKKTQQASSTSEPVDEVEEKFLAKVNLETLNQYAKEKNFAKLAKELGLKVIHVSERDSQTTCKPKQVNEFVNTWSIPGLIEESFAPAELGWGTHEKTLPTDAMTYETGPKNQIALRSRGMTTRVRSWVPSGPIIGYVIRHGEAFGISEYLSVYNEKGECIYRPTCHYAYCPCDSAIASLNEIQMRDFEPQPKQRILCNDIIDGRDELGCLLMGDFGTWFIGSLLDIHETRSLISNQNATTVQVAISLVSVFIWIIQEQNKKKGIMLPDQLDHDHILNSSLPFLGEFVSRKVNWTPYGFKNSILEKDRRFIYPTKSTTVQNKNTREVKIDYLNDEYAWQFEDFLVEVL